MGILAEAEVRVAALVGELRRDATATPADLDRVLVLCGTLEDARRALLGMAGRRATTMPTGRDPDHPISLYSAVAILSTEAAWLARASRSVSPLPPTATPSPVLADAAHALEHATGRLLATPPHDYSAGETSPLS